MPGRNWWILLLLVVSCSGPGDTAPADRLAARPDNQRLVYDYTGVMRDAGESTARYLETIRDRYGIEVLLVALPSLPDQRTISDTATTLFSNWRIGESYNGRGLLLLLVDDLKTVKIEVGFELEDVFTDLFTGHIEDVQLQPNYADGHLDIGLIATMELLEQRAQVKFDGGYTEMSVAALDATYLSQGAGARHVLTEASPQETFSGQVNDAYPPGPTPEEAWQTMIRHWKDKVRDPFLGVYTPVTRLAYREFTNLPDVRLEEEYRHYSDKPFEVLQNDDYAVIYFGKKKGWENSPFLFCRTAEGWQFDLVNQRRYVRMGPSPNWGIEFGEHPYMPLLMDSFTFGGQDIPWPAPDRYTPSRDAQLATQILSYETLHQDDPDDFAPLLALGRLYTLAAMSRKSIGLLTRARQLAPDNPEPYRYLAIAHVNAHYQYDTALAMMDRYRQLAPGDPFGHQFTGYLYYRKKAYKEAVSAFEKALALNPDDCYAHFYLAYAYAWLYDQAAKTNPQRSFYKERFRHHVRQTRRFKTEHPLRVARLDRWLKK